MQAMNFSPRGTRVKLELSNAAEHLKRGLIELRIVTEDVDVTYGFLTQLLRLKLRFFSKVQFDL